MPLLVRERDTELKSERKYEVSVGDFCAFRALILLRRRQGDLSLSALLGADTEACELNGQTTK